MSEGLLKRKLTPSERGCDTGLDDSGDAYFITVEGETWVSLKDVHRIIKEMRNSFPDLSEFFEEERTEVANHWKGVWLGKDEQSVS